MQIHPDEVEDDGEVMLVWDFNVDKINLSLTASQCSVKAKIPPSINTIDSMPHLDPNRVNCNCSKSSKQGKILLSSCAANIPDLQRLSLLDINEEEEEEENEEEQDVEDDFMDLVSYRGCPPT